MRDSSVPNFDELVDSQGDGIRMKINSYFGGFSFYWGLLNGTATIYMFFSAIFWASAEGFPRYFSLGSEIFLEIVFCMDAFFRFTLAKYKDEVFYFFIPVQFAQKADIIYSVCFVISSLPLVTIFAALDAANVIDDLDLGLWSYFMLLKLLRWIDFKNFIDKIMTLLIYESFQNLMMAKLMQNFLTILIFTHFSACSWMLVNKFEDPVVDGSTAFFTKVGKRDAPLIYIYIESLNWAVCAMTGTSFGDVTPQTHYEVLLSVLMMVLGATFYGKIFADFESIMYVTRTEKLEKRKKFEQAKEFCVERKITPTIKKRIKSYFTSYSEGYIDQKYFHLLYDLPLSLQTELSLHLNQDMIRKIKLLNLGSPSFILALSKHLYPKVCMQGDTIIRAGELADKFYFIKRGKVEIIATDHSTLIAILEEGAYFGEVGLLEPSALGKRTANVRALTNCILSVLDKNKFDMILNLFPEQKLFLAKVAAQRIMITNPQDLLDIEFDLLKSINDEMNEHIAKEFKEDGDHLFKRSRTKSLNKSRRLARDSKMTNGIERVEDIVDLDALSDVSSLSLPSRKISLSKISREFNEGISTIMDKLHISVTIMPLSRVYMTWNAIILGAFCYNLIYVPISISFGLHFRANFIAIDLIFSLIYLFDIFVQLLTAIKIREEYITDREKILKIYFTDGFMEDLISFLPLDFFFLLLNVGDIYAALARLLRLLKYRRLLVRFEFIRIHSEKRMPFYRLLNLFLIHILMNHLSACIMYIIANYEFTTGSPKENMFLKHDELNVEIERPFYEKGVFEKYFYFLYWAYQTSSSGPYGDIIAKTNFEKAFQTLVMLVFRLFNAFIAAEVTNLASTAKSSFSDHLSKMEYLNGWLSHIKISQKLQKRINKYYHSLWVKFKGIDDNQILKEIPETIKDDMLISLLREVVEKVRYFPKNDLGIILSIIKNLKIQMITRNEFIFRAGEIAAEMYFIIEGKAVVITPSDGKVIAILHKSDYFGEMGILGGKASTRTASVKAVTNLSLAILSIQDFNFICQQYPSIKEMVKKIAEERLKKNQENLKYDISNHNIENLLDSIMISEKDETPRSLESDSESSVEEPFEIKSNTYESDQKLAKYHTQGDILLKKSKQPTFPKIRKSVLDSLEFNMYSSNFSDPKNKSKMIESSPLGRIPALSQKTVSQNFKDIIEEETEEIILPPIERILSRIEDTGIGAGTELKILNSEVPLKSSDESPSNTDKTPAGGLGIRKWRTSMVLSGDKQKNSDLLKLGSFFGTGYKQNDAPSFIVRENDIFHTNSTIMSILSDFEVVKNQKGDESQNLDVSIIDDATILDSRVLNQIFKEIESEKMDFFVPVKFSRIRGMYILWKKIDEKLSTMMRRLRKNKLIDVLLYFSTLFNIIYLPLYFAFPSYSYTQLILVIEIFNLLIYLCNFLVQTRRIFHETSDEVEIYSIKRNKLIKEVRLNWKNIKSFLKQSHVVLYLLALALPMSLIFEYQDVPFRRTSIILLCIQSVRLTNIKIIYTIFHPLKKKNVALSNTLAIFYSYILIAHVIACFFITVGRFEPDYNKMWFRKLPSPQFSYPENGANRVIAISEESIYIHSLYWTYITTSHIGIGDVSPVNFAEKIYATIVIFLSSLMYMFFFGNLASIIENIAPILKSQMQGSYKRVSDTLKSLSLEDFQERIDKYYNFIWLSDRGVDENKVLENLPTSIKAEIQYQRYKYSFENSKFFKIDSENINLSLTFSILRYLKYRIFLLDELIIIAGQKINEIFILIDGKAEMIDFELKSVKMLSPGDYFGAVCDNSRQPYYILARDYCKVAVLSSEPYSHLSDAYPNWAKNLKKEFTRTKQMILIDLAFFNLNNNRNTASTDRKETDAHLEITEELIQYYSKNLKLFEPNIDGTSNFLEDIRSYSIFSKTNNTDEIKNTFTGNTLPVSPIPNSGSRKRKAFRAKDNTIMNRKMIEKLNSIYEVLNFKSLFIKITPELKYKTDVAHTIMILYTVIALPLYVGHHIDLDGIIITLEIIGCLESIFYVFIQIKSLRYLEGMVTFSWQKLFVIYIKSEKIYDIYATIPMNLILGGVQTVYSSSVILSIFRVSRIIQIVTISKLLSKIESRNRSALSYLYLFKSILMLVCVWHWCSCFWVWFNTEIENTGRWFDRFQLEEKPLYIQYLYASMYLMSLATTTGYPEHIAQNNTERLIYIFFIYIGDAFFAMAFGMMASNSEMFPEKFQELFDHIRKINLLLVEKTIPETIRKRIEIYFAYMIDIKSKNQGYLDSIQDLVPPNIYMDLVYSQSKHLLLKLPIFQEIGTSSLLGKIALLLRSTVFLPNDYIVYKGDLGEEMYFIIDGKVNILSANENQIVATLQKGSYFGEIALFSASRRICSVVAGTFCQLYILDKKNLDEILESFPLLAERFRKEGERRLMEYNRKKFGKNLESKNDIETKVDRETSIKDEIMEDMINSVKIEDEDYSIEAKMSDKSDPNRKFDFRINVISDKTLKQEEQNNNSNSEKELTIKASSPNLKPVIKSSFAKDDNDKNRSLNNENGSNKNLEAKKLKIPDIFRNNENQTSFLNKALDGSRLIAPNLALNSSGLRSNIKKHPINLNNESGGPKALGVEEENEVLKNEFVDVAFNEFVEDGELELEQGLPKQSRRKKCRLNKERRFSRITLGQELILSKFSGLRLQWGVSGV